MAFPNEKDLKSKKYQEEKNLYLKESEAQNIKQASNLFKYLLRPKKERSDQVLFTFPMNQKQFLWNQREKKKLDKIET